MVCDHLHGLKVLRSVWKFLRIHRRYKFTRQISCEKDAGNMAAYISRNVQSAWNHPIYQTQYIIHGGSSRFLHRKDHIAIQPFFIFIDYHAAIAWYFCALPTSVIDYLISPFDKMRLKNSRNPNIHRQQLLIYEK